MKRKIALTVALVGIIGLGVAQADFLWSAGAYFYDSDGTSGSWLSHNADNSVGVFVQLIRDVDGDGVDGVSATGTGVVGDDVVFAASWFGDDGNSGALNQGQWWSPTQGQSMSATAGENGYQFYTRVWDSPAAVWNGTATEINPAAMYFESSIWTYAHDDLTPPDYNMTAGVIEGQNLSGYDYVTTSNAVIPEPATFALAVIGLGLLRAFRKRQAAA